MTRNFPRRAGVLLVGLLATVVLTGCSDGSTGSSKSTELPAGTAPDLATAFAAAPDTHAGFDYQVVATKMTAADLSIVSAPKATESAGRFHAFSGVCSGSGDGHCGEIVFFAGDTPVGALPVESPRYVGLLSQNGTDVVLNLPRYKATDPECCPSGGSIVAEYRMQGSTVIATGANAKRAPKVESVKNGKVPSPF